jgi:hypothetical protein
MAILAFVLMGLVACSPGEPETSSSRDPVAATNGAPETSISSLNRVPLADHVSTEFLRYIRLIEGDYEPAETPADLAREADAVITGTIVDVEPGQSYAPAVGSRPVLTSSVLAIRTDQLLRGDPATVFEDFVYVEVPHPAFLTIGKSTPGTEGSGEEDAFDHAAFAATVPRAYGVFFLDDRTQEPYSNAILDPGMGRPEGARITTPFVQGFILEDENGKPVSVMEPFEEMPPAWHELESIDEIVALAERAF